MIRHFHFHGWPEVGIPAEGKGMIEIIASVQRQQQQSGNHPIVVHCRYLHIHLSILYPWLSVSTIFVRVLVFLCCSAGAGRTGTFIALSNILERVKAEGLLDVFQTVKSLRMQRPHMVQTVVSISRKNYAIYEKNCCCECYAVASQMLHRNADMPLGL